MTTYTNLDGLSVEPENQEYIDYIQSKDYTRVVKCRGQLTGSELEMHTGNVGRTAIVAFVNQRGNYGYLLMDNGRVLDGCFHQFSNGTVSLS